MIYFSVRPSPKELYAYIDEGKLEALALLSAEEYSFKDAPEAARAAAERHNMTFEVWRVEERVQGTYSPKGSNDG